jgi:hypothetical protein
MKRILAPVVLVLLGFGAAGCAAARKSTASGSAVRSFSGRGGLVVTGRVTIPHAKSGTPITCKGGRPTVRVPSGSAGVGAAAVSGPAPKIYLELTRSASGTVTVSCTKK